MRGIIAAGCTLDDTSRVLERVLLVPLGAVGADPALAQPREAGEHRAALQPITNLPGRTDPDLRARSLSEQLAEGCRVAVREARYGLGKPFALYFRD